MASVHELYVLGQIPAKHDVNDNELLATRTFAEKIDKADIAICREMLKKRHVRGTGKMLARIATSIADFQHEFSDRLDHQSFQTQQHAQYFDSMPGDVFLRQHRKSLFQKIEQTQQLIARNTPDVVAPEAQLPLEEGRQPPCPYKASVQALYEEECDAVLLEKLKIIEEDEFAYMDDLMHIVSDPIWKLPPPAPSASSQRPVVSRDPRLGQLAVPLPSPDANRKR